MAEMLIHALASINEAAGNRDPYFKIHFDYVAELRRTLPGIFFIVSQMLTAIFEDMDQTGILYVEGEDAASSRERFRRFAETMHGCEVIPRGVGGQVLDCAGAAKKGNVALLHGDYH